MRQRKRTPYVCLPRWTFDGAQLDLYTLGAAIALAGLEDRWIKLTAAHQRELIGDARFGKQSLGLFKGELWVTRSVCFGTDRDTRFVSPTSRPQDIR